MSRLFFLLPLLLTTTTWATNTDLTIEEYDFIRNRAVILVLDSTAVPIGTTLRVHSKTGVCTVKITEQVNDHLIGATEGCEEGVISPGMKLAYSPKNSWEPRTPASPTTESRQEYKPNNKLREILDRLSLYAGHNFSSQLEGNVYADGSIKDLDGDTALSMGLKGRVYDFTERVSLAAEIGYETPRTLDQATFTNSNIESVQGTRGFSPRLALWSIAVLADAQLIDKLNGFAGLNISLPSLRNSPFSISGDIGFQGGAHYQILPQIGIEGLVKITNLNLKNNVGETTDVSLAGLELRGRYSF